MEIGKLYKIQYEGDGEIRFLKGRITNITEHFVEIKGLKDGTLFLIRLDRIFFAKELQRCSQ